MEESQRIAMDNAIKISKLKKDNKRGALVGFTMVGKFTEDKKDRIVTQVEVFDSSTGEKQIIFKDGMHIKFKGFKKDLK